jgi:hypothetical protein
MKRVSDDEESRDQFSNHKEILTLQKDVDENWSSNQVKHTDMDIPPMERNYISQLTMDSQYMDMDANKQLSQESTNGSIQIQNEQAFGNDTQTNQDDKELIPTNPNEIQNTDNNSRISTRDMEESIDYSLNDTPGREISEQINKCNERMNNSPTIYYDTPIQYGRRMSNQSYESDDSNDELHQRDVESIQNRLFH